MNIFRRHFEKNHKEAANKGSAMVVVIIAMAFIGILASVLMYMSLLNYQMKANNLQAKDNFYSAGDCAGRDPDGDGRADFNLCIRSLHEGTGEL